MPTRATHPRVLLDVWAGFRSGFRGTSVGMFGVFGGASDASLSVAPRRAYLPDSTKFCTEPPRGSNLLRTAKYVPLVSFFPRALYDAINNNPRLRAMATRVEVDDLWGKLHRAPANLRRRSYQAMLEVAVSDGEISSGERQLLDSFRCRHQINDDIHRKFLAELGWTMDQYAIGCQMDAKNVSKNGHTLA